MSDCIIWPGRRHYHGYGLRFLGRGRTQLVHRQVMEVHLDRVLARTEVVRHTCDNPPCYNIEHLRLGTQGDNLDDMRAKGRWRYGPKERCTKCGGPFTLYEHPSGAQYRCEPCYREGIRVRNAAWYQANKERKREYDRQRRAKAGT